MQRTLSRRSISAVSARWGQWPWPGVRSSSRRKGQPLVKHRTESPIGRTAGPGATRRLDGIRGLFDRFPAPGLQVVWRTPVHGGYAGPAVTGGRVFVADYAPTRGLRGVERILSLDAGTGRTLWSREWDPGYIGMLDTWAIGPAATPTVDDDRVYMLGRAGALSCLNAG